MRESQLGRAWLSWASASSISAWDTLSQLGAVRFGLAATEQRISGPRPGGVVEQMQRAHIYIYIHMCIYIPPVIRSVRVLNFQGVGSLCESTLCNCCTERFEPYRKSIRVQHISEGLSGTYENVLKPVRSSQSCAIVVTASMRAYQSHMFGSVIIGELSRNV